MTALIAVTRADEPQTLVTTSGHRFEKARVTEVTPATITIKHATGVARVWLSEFPPDVQKRYRYDAVKAQAWLNQSAAQHWQAEAAEKERKAHAAIRGAENMAKVEAMHRALQGAVYDPMSRRWYRSNAEAQAARKAALDMRNSH
jgi:hypothetical protein